MWIGYLFLGIVGLLVFMVWMGRPIQFPKKRLSRDVEELEKR